METKKINLSGLEKVLSPKEMKNVTGGSDPPISDCLHWTDHGTGTCGFKVVYGGGSCMYGCGMSQSEARDYAESGGGAGWWCCDHCGSSTYCG